MISSPNLPWLRPFGAGGPGKHRARPCNSAYWKLRSRSRPRSSRRRGANPVNTWQPCRWTEAISQTARPIGGRGNRTVREGRRALWAGSAGVGGQQGEAAGSRPAQGPCGGQSRGLADGGGVSVPDTLPETPTRPLCPPPGPVWGSPSITEAAHEEISPFLRNVETQQAPPSPPRINPGTQRRGTNPWATSAWRFLSFFFSCLSVQIAQGLKSTVRLRAHGRRCNRTDVFILSHSNCFIL